MERRGRGTTMDRNAARETSGFVSALSRALAAANRYLVACLHEEGLTELVPSHGDILVYLFAHEAVPMQDLAHAIHRDPSTVTALVKKLAAAGYVSTAKSVVDRRVTEVTLTEKGRALQKSFEAISQRLSAVQMRGIDPVALEDAQRSIDAVRENFERALNEERDLLVE